MWGSPKDQPLLTLTLKFVYTEPPAIGQLPLTFSYPVIHSPGVSLLGLLLWQVMILPVSLIWGAVIFLVTLILSWLKEELLIFSLFSFFHIAKRGVMTSKLPTCWTGNHNSPYRIKAAPFFPILSLFYFLYNTKAPICKSLVQPLTYLFIGCLPD